MRRKIRIHNATHWQSGQLRTFIVRAANFILDEGVQPKIICDFVYRGKRGSGCSGRATINGVRMTIRLPFLESDMDKTDLAGTIAHEIGHLIGKQHADMRGSAKWNRIGNYRDLYSWGEALPLDIRQERKQKRPTGQALAEKQLAHCQGKIKEWKSKQQRAAGMISKWSRKAKYYERRIATGCQSRPAKKKERPAPPEVKPGMVTIRIPDQAINNRGWDDPWRTYPDEPETQHLIDLVRAGKPYKQGKGRGIEIECSIQDAQDLIDEFESWAGSMPADNETRVTLRAMESNRKLLQQAQEQQEQKK